jgi:predicted transposase YbfD/YdcC
MMRVQSDDMAFEEAGVFLGYFEELPDGRQCGKVRYPQTEVLLLCLLAVLSGAETFPDIANFGKRKRTFLLRFRPFARGTLSYDHLGDILATLDAEAFQRCFVAWVASLTGVATEVIAIDGKTVRRSKGAKVAIHMVSAFAARQRLVLGQVKVAEKANEIVAIPKLLAMLEIEGAIVTIDAMGCQRAIAQQIIDQKADYVLALKGNQSSLQEDVRLFVTEQKARDYADTTISQHETVDGDHDRIETRVTTVIHDVKWLQECHKWPALKSVVIIDSICEIGTRTERETRFYISSLDLPADRLGPIVRSHWAVDIDQTLRLSRRKVEGSPAFRRRRAMETSAHGFDSGDRGRVRRHQLDGLGAHFDGAIA